jgi:hypothetical protein
MAVEKHHKIAAIDATRTNLYYIAKVYSKPTKVVKQDLRNQKKHRSKPRKITRAASCQGKSKLSKNGAFGRVRTFLKEDGANMTAYKCTFGCKLPDNAPAWHVGHRVRRFRPK